ncbi:hypothetical protein FGO68_gene10233 [Halteria grandinella]|uniref:Uncharacterized protein n=1 Tax=Halteria grandinella TaxID=5974 RepID=A0A8J8SWX9_HALGN|nr:hypothetical protein FGO68_gene10233 [Halteria grandinella]
MLAHRLRIVRLPAPGPDHRRPVMLLDREATFDAGEMRLLRLVHIEIGEEVLPFEDLLMTALWTWHVEVLLRAGFAAFRNPASRHDQRRRNLEHLRELIGPAAAVRLLFRISGRVDLPFRQIVLHLASHRHLTERGRRVGTGDQQSAPPVDPFLVKHRIGAIAGLGGEDSLQRSRRFEHRRQLHLRPPAGVVLGGVDIEEVAGIHFEGPEREDIGKHRAAELGGFDEGDRPTRIVRAERPEDLGEIGEEVGIVVARKWALTVREADVVDRPSEVVDRRRWRQSGSHRLLGETARIGEQDRHAVSPPARSDPRPSLAPRMRPPCGSGSRGRVSGETLDASGAALPGRTVRTGQQRLPRAPAARPRMSSSWSLRCGPSAHGPRRPGYIGRAPRDPRARGVLS